MTVALALALAPTPTLTLARARKPLMSVPADTERIALTKQQEQVLMTLMTL